MADQVIKDMLAVLRKGKPVPGLSLEAVIPNFISVEFGAKILAIEDPVKREEFRNSLVAYYSEGPGRATIESIMADMNYYYGVATNMLAEGAVSGDIELGKVWQSLTNSLTPISPTTTTKIHIDHIPDITLDKLQDADDLKAIEGLTGAGFLVRVSEGSWTIDTTKYLPLTGGTLDNPGNLDIRGTLSVGLPAANRATSLYGTLSVTGTATLQQLIVQNSNEINNITSGGLVCLNYAHNGNVLLANGGGNVGIGRTTPTQKLDVAGIIKSSSDQIVSSDATLKENLLPIVLTLDEIADAPAVTFDWKDRRQGRSAGSIAQYWKKLLPEVVFGEEGDLALSYSQLGVILAINLAREVRNLLKLIKG